MVKSYSRSMARNDTRQKMVDTAVLQFQRHGYRSTSWRGLVEAGQTPWGSVQHHFPGGKEELGEAALDRAGDLVRDMLAAALASAGNPADGIRDWFAVSATTLEGSGFSAGCPVAPVALEMAVDSDRLAAASSDALSSWVGTVAESLRDAGIGRKRAEALAATVISGFEGALILARASRSTEPLARVGDTLAAVVADELTPG